MQVVDRKFRFSDVYPGARFAQLLGKARDSGFVEHVISALDEVFPQWSADELTSRHRLGRWSYLRALTKTVVDVAPHLERADRRLVVQRILSEDDLISVGMRSQSRRATLDFIEAYVLALASGRRVDRTGAFDSSWRRRRMALVVSAALMSMDLRFRLLHGGGLRRLVMANAETQDLTGFVAWAASGDEVPALADEFQEAWELAKAGGTSTADEPQMPAKGTVPYLVLHKLAMSPAGDFVAPRNLRRGNPRDAVAKLRQLGWGIETAPRASKAQGWRLLPEHRALLEGQAGGAGIQ